MLSKAYSIATDFKALIIPFITSYFDNSKDKALFGFGSRLSSVHAKTHKRTNHSLCVTMNFLFGSIHFSFDLHPTAPDRGCGVKHPIVKKYKNYPNNMRPSTFD